MLASVLWSDIPIVSFKRWTREFIALVMIFIVISESEPRQAFQSLLRRIIYILIPFSYVLINYFPEYGREYHIWEGNVMWIGVATQKNGLGIICLITIFYLVWSFIRRKQGRDIPATGYQTYLEVFILILTLWLMGGPKHNLSFSVASNVSLLLGLFTLIAYSWIKKIDGVMSSKALLVIVAMIISYGTITPFVGKLYVADISSSFGRDTTLTGRDEIWADLVKQAMQRPFFGYGFGGFWTSKAIEEARIASAHNGYLEIILNIGFIGHMIFFILLLSCCLKAQREIVENSDWGICALCYLLMAVVHNMVESSCAGITGKIFVVALLLAVSPIANPLYIRTGGRKVSRNTMRNKLRHTFAKNMQVSHNSYTI